MQYANTLFHYHNITTIRDSGNSCFLLFDSFVFFIVVRCAYHTCLSCIHACIRKFYVFFIHTQTLCCLPTLHARFLFPFLRQQRYGTSEIWGGLGCACQLKKIWFVFNRNACIAFLFYHYHHHRHRISSWSSSRRHVCIRTSVVRWRAHKDMDFFK